MKRQNPIKTPAPPERRRQSQPAPAPAKRTPEQINAARTASLEYAAQSLRHDPFYLGGALHAYQERQGWGAAELAEWLGCDPDEIPLISLCRRPAAADPRRQEDIENIARRFGLPAGRLAKLLKEVANV